MVVGWQRHPERARVLALDRATLVLYSRCLPVCGSAAVLTLPTLFSGLRDTLKHSGGWLASPLADTVREGEGEEDDNDEEEEEEEEQGEGEGQQIVGGHSDKHCLSVTV